MPRELEQDCIEFENFVKIMVKNGMLALYHDILGKILMRSKQHSY